MDEVEVVLPEKAITLRVRVKDAALWESRLAIAGKLIAILEADCGAEVTVVLAED